MAKSHSSFLLIIIFYGYAYTDIAFFSDQRYNLTDRVSTRLLGGGYLLLNSVGVQAETERSRAVKPFLQSKILTPTEFQGIVKCRRL